MKLNSIDDCYFEIDLIVGHFCSTCFAYVMAVNDFERIQRKEYKYLLLRGKKFH